MPNSAWQDSLNESSTENEVIGICNRFVTDWSFEDLGRLPAACQPKPVLASEDVGPYAHQLIARLGDGSVSSAPMLHRMSTFFTKAALRLVEIDALAPAAPAEPQGPAYRTF